MSIDENSICVWGPGVCELAATCHHFLREPAFPHQLYFCARWPGKGCQDYIKHNPSAKPDDKTK